ncbi:MAG: sporulation protein YunB [Faecalibacterium sp.]
MQNKTNVLRARRVKRECQGGRRMVVRVLVGLAIFFYLLFLLEQQIRPILRAVVEYESRNYAITSFNEAVQAHLAEYPEVYEDLYQVTWDADDVPTSVVANSYQLNLMRSQLALAVLESLKENQEHVYSFHIGRLTGIQMFAAWGPVITLKMEPESYVIATVYNTLESAGENQTLLSVYGNFTVQINVSMAGYLQTLTVENDVLLWQNLLLGRVPDVNV